MLQITIPAREMFDNDKNMFITTKAVMLSLEHSLVSLSKWESKWCKSFLNTKEFTYEQFIDYVKCMTITQNVSDDVYSRLTNENVEDIKQYINAPMTATTISDRGTNGRRSSEIVTAELIYFWMISHNIPFKCEKWHLNRLMTLIRVCNVKSSKPKPMSKRQLMSRNAQLNAARREQYNSMG